MKIVYILCTHEYVCKHVGICVYVFKRIRANINMCIIMYLYVYVCIKLWVNVCMCLYVYHNVCALVVVMSVFIYVSMRVYI